jgi:NADP-dependent 3-hydroxy acid dehydrogenase YdfG
MNNPSTFDEVSLSGQNAVITGGTTGIGRAIALALLQRGVNVLITGQDPQHMEDALADMQKVETQAQVSGVLSDLATKEGVMEVFNETDTRFSKLDIFINNAGLSSNSAMEDGYEDWKYVIETNLLSYIACTHHAINRMKKNKKGQIINVGSMSAESKSEGSSVYVATKAGIRGFSASLRKEANELGIRVTLIEPGKTGADMQEMPPEEQRKKIEKMEMLKAEDIAAAVCYVLTQPQRADIVELKIRPIYELI